MRFCEYDPLRKVRKAVVHGDPVNDPVKLSEDARKIFEAIRQNNEITREELAHLCNKSLATVRRRISELKKNGYIERVGSDKVGYYRILKKEE